MVSKEKILKANTTIIITDKDYPGIMFNLQMNILSKNITIL